MSDMFGSMLGGMAQPTAQPTAADLLAQMKPEQPVEPGVSQRDRLLLAGKALSNGTPTPPPVVPVPKVSAQNVNVAARKLQYAETSADQDPDAVWRKLEQRPELLKGKPGKQLTKLLAGDRLPETDWEELKESLGVIAGATGDVADDLKVGAGKIDAVYTAPDGVWMTVNFPADKTEDPPLSLTGKPSRVLPQMALDWEAGDGISTFVGPTDVIYAAKPTPEIDAQLRQLRPGPLGADGIPRWVAVTPLPLTHLSVLEGVATGAPGAIIDSYPVRDSYPGTKGGDWIVWDVPDSPVGPKRWKAPAWTQGREERIQAGQSVPEYAMKALTKADIPDERMLHARMDDTAWAIFEAQSDPNATSHLVSRLKRQGLEPIELEAEGRRAWLVFGVDPDNAVQLSPKRPVWTNTGTLWDREVEPRSFSVRTVQGLTAIEVDDSPSAPALPRTQRRVSRYAFQVDPEQSNRLARFAADLEATGGTNLAIYNRDPNLEGFEVANDHLFTDTVGLRVVRTAGRHVGHSNAIPVFVRSTVGLPTEPPQVAQAIDTRGLAFEQRGKSVKVEAGEDLEQAVQSAAVLAAVYGHDNVKVIGPRGGMKLYRPA